jgi:three-Cys-motif partner protein
MGKLVPGSDGLPAEEVGKWVEEKHFFITEYIKLSHGARRQFIGPNDAGAAYIDLFCGPGQAKIKGTEQYVDGAAVVAWNSAKDEARRDHCATRLRTLGAPVVEIRGTELGHRIVSTP